MGLDKKGVVKGGDEMFFMRLGVLRLRQRWIEREVSKSLTGTVVMGIAMGGFVLGVLASRFLLLEEGLVRGMGECLEVVRVVEVVS